MSGPDADDFDQRLLEAEQKIVRELSDELAAARTDNANLIKRRDELLALIANLSQTVPLESEVSEALEQRGALLAEIGTLRSKLHFTENALLDSRLLADVQLALIEELREKLRIAEAVRDDARATSQRYLDEKRTLMSGPSYVQMATDRLEAVAKSELRILAEFAAQEIKERDDKIVAIAAVLQGVHDDASAMIEAIRKIVVEKAPRVHTDCVNMPGGMGPCACLDGCGACDSCGRSLDESNATLAREGKIDSPPKTPGEKFTAAYDQTRLAQMQQDAAEKRRLLELGKIVVDTGVASTPVSSDRVEGWKKGVLESIDKLTAFQMNGNQLTYDKALELLNNLYQHPPTFGTTVITREQLVEDQTYKTWVPTAADDAIIGEPIAARLVRHERFETNVVAAFAHAGAPDLGPPSTDVGEEEPAHEQCLDCGAEMIGHHACQGVPGGFSDDPEEP